MRLFIIIFGLVGLGMGIGEFFILKSVFEFRSQAVVVDGEVVDFVTSRGSKGGTMYAPVVRYSVPAPEGGSGETHEIRGSVSSSSRGYDIGERVEVMYLPDAPAEGRIRNFMEQWFLPTIFGLFTLVFGGVAAGFLVAEIRRQRMYAWLQHSGMTIQARINEVARNTSLKVNGRSPWVILAQWQHPVTQEMHVFESENLWYDPSEFIGDREQIPVRVDADDPARHRVDISWLPKKAG
jgi:hypothetical protein